MLPKLFASWLVVLIVVPFTAPFSICDLTSVLGSVPGHHTPLVPPRSASVKNDAAVSTVPCISTAGRVRLMPLSGDAPAPRKTNVLSAHLLWSGASPGSIRAHSILTTILRL